MGIVAHLFPVLERCTMELRRVDREIERFLGWLSSGLSLIELLIRET